MTFVDPELNGFNPWPYLLEILWLVIYSLSQYSVTRDDKKYYAATKLSWAPSNLVIYAMFEVLSIAASIATSTSYVLALSSESGELGANFVMGAVATIVNVWAMWKWQFWFFGERNNLVALLFISLSFAASAISSISYFIQETWLSGGLSLFGASWLFYLTVVNVAVVARSDIGTDSQRRMKSSLLMMKGH